MIRSFKCKETEKLFDRNVPRKFSKKIHRTALRKLEYVNAATDLNDLRSPPGNHLEKLSGKRKGQHSIRINDQWRICFKWKSGDAYHVEITDYH
ncbi:type II toxin-antitoxin system RelE/ParE family toxin [Patescibacteria group bacterium]|nr:type II toxin-antitoxin system RelE/ParE family toxin [Patescibacteria group bacterium]MBU1683487.1 type II toxin-antitoxin system RelE/ParE family toxin [Patescibacteria group bacterium]MBU1935057.1 type II toxin-antitoxin system RelE/ParE family toxin [Patescibacteria group bacterium]